MTERVNLGLELTSLHTEHRTRGFGRVAQAYLERLSERDEFEIIPYTSADFPRRNGEDGAWKNKLWERWRLAWSYYRQEPDLIQIIDPMKVPPFSSVPVVTMVHDLIPYIYRERYQPDLLSWYLHWRMKGQIKKSAGIITPSRSTADDLVMMFDIPAEQIEQIPHGIDHERFYPRSDEEIVELCEKYELNLPYFIMVADLSTYKPHKGLESVVKKWTDEALANVSLVVVGEDGKYSDRLRQAWPVTQDRLLLPGYVDDAELAAFYTGASGLIFPSRYEGFGFPVLEAMACGTRPLVRNVGSLKEIVDTEAICLEDNEFDSRLVEALEVLLDNKAKDTDCISHAQQFTWEKTTSKLKDYYRQLL